MHAPSALIRERLFEVREGLFGALRLALAGALRYACGLSVHGFGTERARLDSALRYACVFKKSAC